MDWRDATAYQGYAGLSAAEWAWQFLRRNPDYRRDYVWFAQCWATLEARYGAPPHRDFFHWRQDPLAWRSEAELSGCGTDVCPGQDDQVLIECWMGARWGFRRFPPDPAQDFPILGDGLVWREMAPEPEAVTALAALPEERLVLAFDPLLPPEAQLDVARRLLVARRHALKKAGRLPPGDPDARAGLWTRQIRLLDGWLAGADARDLAALAGQGDAGSELEQARWMIQRGYRYLPSLDGA